MTLTPAKARKWIDRIDCQGTYTDENYVVLCTENCQGATPRNQLNVNLDVQNAVDPLSRFIVKEDGIIVKQGTNGRR